VVSGAFGLILCLQASAQLPLHPPEIRTLFPIGGNRGATVETRVAGVNIGDASGVVVGGVGVTAEVLASDGSALSVGAPPGARLVNDTEARVRFRIAPEAEPGVREFRLYTPTGLSCRGLFLVSAEGAGCPSLREQEPDDDTPQDLPVPAALDGRMDRRDDVDRFRVRLASGESVTFYVEASAAESELDSMLTLRDSRGRQVAENDDFLGKDAALAYTAPAAGEYVLELREVDAGGGPEYGYRLFATRAPLVRCTYPLAAAPGMLADVSLFGLNLGGAGKTSDGYAVPFDATQARVQVPAEGPGTRHFRVATPSGETNPFALRILDVADVREQEPNDDPEQAVRVQVPGAAHGRIFGGAVNPGGDADRWKFAARKGEKLHLSVLAMRAGSPLDAALAIRGPDGKRLAANDDAGGSRDPQLDFEAPADADYMAEVTSAAGGGSVDAAYMLRIDPVKPPAPDFALRLYPVNPSIPRGGSVPVEVKVTRSGGFTGSIRFELPSLPKGVTALIPPEAATADRFYVALRAAEDAPYAMAPFQVTGTAEIDGRSVTHPAEGDERVWKGQPLRPVPTALRQVAVCEPMDFTVRLDRDTLELHPGETKEVTVLIRKIRGYPRGIPVRAATVDYNGGALPAGLSVGRVTLAAEATEVRVPVAAAADTKPGDYTIFICGLSNPTTNDYILIAQLAPPLLVRVR
jgi:hypothetical protein